MQNKLSITKVNNGFLIDWEENLSEDFDDIKKEDIKLEKKVIEEINNDGDDCMKRLLDFVNEYFK